jgi:hypothetical protein
MTTSDSDDAGLKLRLKAVVDRQRGYSDFFDYPPDRDLAEIGVLDSLLEAMSGKGTQFFIDPISRGRGNDPPDCEAQLIGGGRIGFEVTELIDSETIRAVKSGRQYQWAHWTASRLIDEIEKRLRSKAKPENVKGGPYDEYAVLIHSDEPELTFPFVTDALRNVEFPRREPYERAFFLLSYMPGAGYQYLELSLHDV